MERLKRVIRQALSEKAHRIKLQFGTEFEILAQQGIRMMPDGPLIDEAYLHMLYAKLLPHDQENIARKVLTKGALMIPNVGTVYVIAAPMHPASLRLYLPPRGQEMFQTDWDRLQSRLPPVNDAKEKSVEPFEAERSLSPTPNSMITGGLAEPKNPSTSPLPRFMAAPGENPTPPPANRSEGGNLNTLRTPLDPPGTFVVSSSALSSAPEPTLVPSGGNSIPDFNMFNPPPPREEKYTVLPKIPLPTPEVASGEASSKELFGAELLSHTRSPLISETPADEAYVPPVPTFETEGDLPLGSFQSVLDPPSSATPDFRIKSNDSREKMFSNEILAANSESLAFHQDPPLQLAKPPTPLAHAQPSPEAHATLWSPASSIPMAKPLQEPQTESVIVYRSDDEGGRDDTRVEKPLDEILRMMIRKRASDLHLTCDQPLCLRIDGDIQRVDNSPVDALRMEQLIEPILPQKNRKEFAQINDTDFAYELPGVGRFRVNLFRDKNGVGSVIRHIPSKILTSEQLNLPPIITKFCQLTKGLVLVTGPTGSGKSTTLAAMLDWINKNRAEHILTIEDPVEFVHPQQRCLVNQREVHRHTTSFARALKAALREDPDIILIGEMRDLETIAIAIETAETGHLVFGTLHTTTAISTVDRIIDQFPSDRQAQIRTMLASSLKGVVAQTLLKKKGGGRIAAHEILVLNDAVAAMIREGKIHMIANHMQTQKADGNVLLNESLFKLIKENVVDVEDALKKAVDKNSLYEVLKRHNLSTTSPPAVPGGATTKNSGGGQRSA